jgi:hypothetical protein
MGRWGVAVGPAVVKQIHDRNYFFSGRPKALRRPRCLAENPGADHRNRRAENRRTWFVGDSPLEGDGFEPSVPRSREGTRGAKSDL